MVTIVIADTIITGTSMPLSAPTVKFKAMHTLKPMAMTNAIGVVIVTIGSRTIVIGMAKANLGLKTRKMVKTDQILTTINIVAKTMATTIGIKTATTGEKTPTTKTTSTNRRP